jgi:DNA-binding transcriptional MerR regulator
VHSEDATLAEIPQKLFYKIGEVCQYTDTQPYVLRFWESEFPGLAGEKNRNGQRVYRRQDIDLILRIKRLLYEEEYTIAEARKRLEDDALSKLDEEDGKGKAVTAPGRKISAKHAKQAAPPPPRAPEPPREAPAPEPASVPLLATQAVEDLVRRLDEANAQLARTREALHAEEHAREACRQSKLAVAERIEALLERMKDRAS